MTQTILIADNSTRDQQRFRSLMEDAGFEVELCSYGSEVDEFLNRNQNDLAAIFLLWEISGPPFGGELLFRFRRSISEVPVVVVSNSLDASIAIQATALGARDFLEKPLDLQRVKSCLDSLFINENRDSPLIESLNNKILGKSAALLEMLRQIAKVIENRSVRILLIGESGTGKELIAQSIRNLSQKAEMPFVAVNVAAIPKELIESELFGHEKGAFTGASNVHEGYLEEAADGILFLDEIGELDISLQVKLLRVLEENNFRRIKGKNDIKFNARVVCATNVDLKQAVNQGTFRKDLYYRISQETIIIPALRERTDDIDLLLEHFAAIYGGEKKNIRFSRESLTILRSYAYPGNVRQLGSIVKSAINNCNENTILPQHLPLSLMGDFLLHGEEISPFQSQIAGQTNEKGNVQNGIHNELFQELVRLLPENWLELKYDEAFEYYERAFDRVYLPNLIKKHRYNITKAIKAAEIYKKKFSDKWENTGLPSYRDNKEEDG